jgi:hypothetical protein
MPCQGLLKVLEPRPFVFEAICNEVVGAGAAETLELAGSNSAYTTIYMHHSNTHHQQDVLVDWLAARALCGGPLHGHLQSPFLLVPF